MITPLYLCILKEDSAASNILLLKSSVDVNFFHPNMRYSYLAQACLRNCYGIVYLLITAGADVDFAKRLTKEMHPLWIALLQNNLPIFRLLLSSGSNMHDDFRTSKDGTLMIGLMVHRRLDLLECLLEKRPHLLSSNCGTESASFRPASMASIVGHIAVLRILKKHGADFDDTPKDELTPLHCAAYKGFYNVIKYLLYEGAVTHVHNLVNTDIMPCMKNVVGCHTPFSLACARGNTRCAQLLMLMGNANPCPSQNVNLCVRSIKFMVESNLEPLMMSLIIQKGAPMSFRCFCHFNQNYLDLAVQCSCYNLAVLLVSHGLTATWNSALSDFIPCLSEPLLTVLLMSGVCNSYNSYLPPHIKSMIKLEYSSRCKHKILTLEEVCVQAIRFSLQVSVPVHSPTVWNYIDKLPLPLNLKRLLKLDSYVKF